MFSQSVIYIFASRIGLIRCLATIVWPATNTASQRTKLHQSRIIQHICPNSMQSITPNASRSTLQNTQYMAAHKRRQPEVETAQRRICP